MSADLRSKVNSFNDAVNETINYIGDLVTEVRAVGAFLRVPPTRGRATLHSSPSTPTPRR